MKITKEVFDEHMTLTFKLPEGIRIAGAGNFIGVIQLIVPSNVSLKVMKAYYLMLKERNVEGKHFTGAWSGNKVNIHFKANGMYLEEVHIAFWKIIPINIRSRLTLLP